ncbi:hypothetical protein O3P69_002102 [Scylla paramamosain]|uniref:Copper transporter n=1 Tax=Scylla paramamosain TaxID=85552 RepID=A0AAW0V572_SCYPA
MSSSCVPPKNCVVHNPDPSGHDDHSDTSSECGSLCSCTSGSMTSLATISSNSRVPDRAAQESECAALVTPTHVDQVVPQSQEEEENNRYFLVRASQRACCRKLRNPACTSSLRHFLVTSSEFFPWVAGFVIIYYSYCWWGMASGFSAFLFMIGAHAFLRLVKTRGVLGCVPYSSQTQVESDASEGEDDAEADLQQETPEATIDRSAEKPPSYDVAVVKPPPYDLKFHLTPKELHSGPRNKPGRCHNAGRHAIPATVSMVDESENDVLPSYQDAMKLSFHTYGHETDQRRGESS